MLLARTIDQNMVQDDSISIHDDDSITVAAGVLLQSNGGTITLTAPLITIRDGVTLRAEGGGITLTATATATTFNLPISVVGTAMSLFEGISDLKARVDIGSNVTIAGGSLTIHATCGDNPWIGSIPYVGQILEPIADVALPYVADDTLGLPLSVQLKQPESSISIGSGSSIEVDGRVSIRSEATATAVGEAIWSRMADYFVQEFGRVDDVHGGLAAGFSYADAQATVNVSGSIVSRQGSVGIDTSVTSTAAMKARVTLNQGLQQTNPDNVAAAYAGGMTNATSRVTIAEAAQIDAHANVAITASATDTLALKAATDSYRDGRVGVVVATGFTAGTVEVIVNGSIRAGQANVPAPLEFDPALAVDFASSAVVFPNAVEFRTGDAVAYSSGRGGAIPGLESGRTYFAIYDPARPRQLRLAGSASDAAAGRAIDFGAGYPTLTGAKGTLPIVTIDPDDAGIIRFGFAAWPDGSPLFVDGEVVQYKAAAGHFLGRDDAAGMLLGPLPDGAYSVQVVSGGNGGEEMRIRLVDAGGGPVRFNPRPHFVTDAGVVCQVDGFDGDAATVAVSAGGSASTAAPRQPAALTNGQRIRYVQGFGAVVPGLIDGRDYFAVVDPENPGVIRLADSQRQAVSADPAVRRGLPKLETTATDAAASRTVDIEGVQPGIGLIFTVDPLLPAGTPVVYREVAGKPVGGLVDGTTYYAYPLENPFFDADDPQYVVGLRTVADASAPLVGLRLRQSLSAAGDDFLIDGIDRLSAALSLSLPQAASVTRVDSSQLVGAAATITPVPAGSTQIWTNATAGAFTISLPDGTTRKSTAPIPHDATAATLRQAINAVGLPGVQVADAFGRGRYEEPWTLVGSGLDDLEFALDSGGSVWADTTANELQAVSTAAAGGTFTLTLDVGGVPRTTAPLPSTASAADVARAIDDLGGVLAGRVTGSGTAASPWLVGTRVQPLRTGDPVVFRDAWSADSLGLAHGETLYAIVPPASQQGRDGSVVVRLAATAADALAAEPVAVPLTTTIAFGAADRGVMSGPRHTFESTNQATGIHLAATLVSDDSVKVVSQNGDQPSFVDYLSRGDMALRKGLWSKLITRKNFLGLMPNEQSALAQNIENRLGAQKSNEGWTVSAAVAVLHVDNTTRVVVGPKATLTTSGGVVITSKVTERVGTSVDGKLCKPTRGSVGIALAVDVATVKNRSHAIVQAGARIVGAAGVTVDAQTVYPWAGAWIGDLVSAVQGAGSVSDALADFHTSDFLVNHYVGASTSYFYAKDKASQQLAKVFAASTAYVAIANDTVAQVEDGVSINQDVSIAAECPVRVTAATDVAQTALAGSLYIATNPLTRGQNALGFSVGILSLENTTRALLGGVEKAADGTPQRAAGPLLVKAGTGGVAVRATNDTLILQQAIGGTDATGFGLSGMAAVIDARTGSQVTEAVIAASVVPGGGARIESAGDVDVEATDTTLLIPVAGALVLSERRAFGIGTAFAFLDRDVTARVGSKDDEDAARVGEVLLNAAKDVQVSAAAKGVVVPSAIAGVGASRAKPAAAGQDIAAEGGGEQPPVPLEGSWGLGVSGAFTLADVDDDVRATVYTTGVIASTAPAAGSGRGPTLGVAASNTTVVVSTAGAVLDRSQNSEGTSGTLAGAVSLVDGTSSVVATVRRATVKGFALDVTAKSTRDIVSNAAGGSAEPQPRAGATQVQIAGSVTVNTIRTTTLATVDHVAGEGLLGVKTDAKTDDWIWSLAGSGLIDRRRADGQPEGRRIGIGVGFARNDVTATTRATVVGSALTVTSGGMQVTAGEASEVFTFAAGFIWSSAAGEGGDRSWFVDGMVAFVTATSTVEAAIDDGTIDVDGAIDVVATSALMLITGAGNLLVSAGRAGSLAAGASWANVDGTISATARVGKGSVRVRRGNLSVRSQTQKPESDPRSEAILDGAYTPKRDDAAIWTFAVGVVTSNSTVAADGSVCWNTLSSTRSASIEDSAVVRVDDGGVEVRAIDEATSVSAAGAITVKNGAAAAAAAGAAVVRNKLTATTTAGIVSSNADVASGGVAGGGIAVEAVTTGLVFALAVGAEVAGRVALGAAVVHDDVTHTVVAEVRDAREKNAGARHSLAATGNIGVKAEDRSRIVAAAGQVDVATEGVGAGAAAAVNTIASTVEATIAGVDVRSSGAAISVDADAAGEIDAYAFGVVGAFGGDVVGFGGVGSGTGNTLTRRVAAMVESDAHLESHGLTVTADDSAKSVAIAGAGDIQSSGSKGVSVAFGVSVATNRIDRSDADQPSVEAAVRSSSVTAHGTVQVAATAELEIRAITVAGVGSSLGGTVALAGAGAGSGNTVDATVSAHVSDSRITQDAGDIAVKANNDASILAVAGGLALAGLTTGSSLEVTVGAAVAVNTLTVKTNASVDEASAIDSPGALTVDAGGLGAIKARSFGVAGSLVGTTKGGAAFNFTGGGSGSGNTIDMTTTAAIGSSPTGASANAPSGVPNTSVRARNVSVTAHEKPSIVAAAGSLVIDIGFKDDTSVGLAVGASITINDVKGKVSADIDNAATVVATDGVDVSARCEPADDSRKTIESLAIAGSIAGGAATTGVLVPLAGAVSLNTVDVTIAAAISGQSDVRAGGAISVTAIDGCEISSDTGGGVVGIEKTSSLAAAVGVGFAHGQNTITNTVRARIENATAAAGGGVAVSASASPSIHAYALGVALTVAVSSGAASAAGSGAAGYSTIDSTIDAAILSATVEAATGRIDVTALDAPQIKTKAHSGAGALTWGDGVALAPGVVILESKVTDTVTARIGRSVSSAADPVVVAKTGALGVTATSAADVSSSGIAVAATVAIGEEAGGLAAVGTSSSVLFQSTITAAIDAGSVTATAVQVVAVDGDSCGTNTIGGVAVVAAPVGLSLGVSLTDTTAKNTSVARIGTGDTAAAPTVVATDGGITVDARSAHSLATECVATSVAASAGASGAGGHALTLDTSTSLATVAKGALLRATGTLLVQARNAIDGPSAPDGRLDARVYGVGAAAPIPYTLVVGAVIAKTTDTTVRQATIGDDVDLSGVAALDLLADARPNVHATSVAVDVGGVAVTVNQSTVTTNGTVRAATGSNVTLPRGDVRVIARGTSRLEALQTGVAAGYLAAGATQTTGESRLATVAELGAGTITDEARTGGLVVRAVSLDAGTSIGAVSGSGGLFAGFGTIGELTDATTTRTTVLGGTIHAGAVDIGVDRRSLYDVTVDSTNIAILAGVGSTQASVSASHTAHDGLDRVRVGIASTTTIAARDRVTILANHAVVRTATHEMVRGVGGALGTYDNASATVDVHVPAVIALDDGVSITSGDPLAGSPGGLTILPTAVLEVSGETQLHSGGLATDCRFSSSLSGAVTPQVVLGNGVQLVSHGQLNVGTLATVASSVSSHGWSGGAIAGISTTATADVTVDQRVQVGRDAVLRADGSLSLTPGDEPTGGGHTYVSLDAYATADVYGAFTDRTAKARAKVTQHTELSFAGSADVSSGGSMYLSARVVEPEASAHGWATSHSINGGTDSDGDVNTRNKTSLVSLNGVFVAGRENRLDVTITGGTPGGTAPQITTNVDSVFGVPVRTAWQTLADFSPSRHIDEAGYSGDVKDALLSGVAQGTVDAIQFVPARPVMVSGGSVTVTADVIAAAPNTTLTANVGAITIRSDSPDYLLLRGGLAIANIEGGRVDFRDSKGAANSHLPADLKVVKPGDDDLTPEIEIRLDAPRGAGDAAAGPALFVEAPLVNLGGKILIHNEAGSFGQTATVAAKEIVIKTPNGVVAVDTPNDAWNAAGTPSAQLADLVTWPGGNPRRGRANANQAVMYAINAMTSPVPGGAGWTMADDDDRLNQWVYGDPLDDRPTYVFFGGSAPQYKEFIGNKQKTNELLAKDARPDGQAAAWQMTTKGYDHGKSAYVPALQHLDTLGLHQTDLPTPSRETAISGQVIVINAKVANINGTIEAGGTTTDTQSVVIPAHLESFFESYRQQYQLGAAALATYRIPDSRLDRVSPDHRLIGASFDARTGRIMLDDATSAAGGSVSITGRIINTAGALAKIKVRSGSGDIIVRNETSLPLAAGNLQTVLGQRQAVVSITDLNVGDASQRQTTYVYDGDEILVYRGGALREHVAGSQATFTPQPGARWEWQAEAEMHRDVNTNLETTGSDNWPGVDATGWTFTNPDDPWETVGGAAGGRIVFAESATEYPFTQQMKASLVDSQNVKVPYQKADFDTGFSADHKLVYPSRISLAMTMSVKADWAVGIDFGGTSVGRISLESVGSVLVGSGLVGKTVAITSTAGRIDAVGGGFLTATAERVGDTGGANAAAEGLLLDAAKGIGSAAAPVQVAARNVRATTVAGDVFLDGRRGDMATPLSLLDVAAPAGTVSVMAAGDVRRAGGAVQAAAVSVTSIAGAVGSAAAPLVLVAGPRGMVQVDASAAGGIHIEQNTGDMLVGTVASSGFGAVDLFAAGSIYNADTWTIDPVAADRRIAALVALGATDPNAYLPRVRAFESLVRSQYVLSWSLRGNLENLSLWRPRTAAALGVADPQPGSPSDDQIRTYVAGLQGDLATFFTQTFGTGWMALPQFQAFDPAYTYTATPDQVERIRDDRTATDAELAVMLQARALDAPPPGESVAGRVNITAGTLRIASLRGSVGRNDLPVTITAAALAAGSLTPLQKQELALAAVPGDATLTGDGGVVLNVRRPIILAVRGRVDVDAAAGIAIAQQSGDLHVGRVTSDDGLVSVIADGDILNAGTAIDMWGTAIGFEQPSDWTRVGNAGQSLSTQGLLIPGYGQTASGTWYGRQVSTGSFRASFTYEASAGQNPGDGLAFVLQSAGTSAVGAAGSGLGYRGIKGGAKVGLLINLFQPNTPGITFDRDGSWVGGGFQKLPFPLTGRPVYVTLVYDATASTMEVTVSDQPQPTVAGARSSTFTYRDVDLADVLGPSAFVGFTSGTGGSVTTQQVTQFSFASDRPLAAEHVTLVGQATWALTSSDPGRGGFVLSTPPEGPTLTFPSQPDLAAAAWYPHPVRVSTDFRVTFRYRYDDGQSSAGPGNGMALVFQTSDDGVAALGVGGAELGYTGISGRKVGYLINVYAFDADGDGVGTRFDRLGGAGGQAYNACRLPMGAWIDVTLTYDSTAHTVKELLTWTSNGTLVTLREATTTGIDLTAMLGRPTALFGVTASSGAATAVQQIRAIDFSSPRAVAPDDVQEWELNGSVQSLANGVLTIPAVKATATSSWYGRPVSTDSFTVGFTYEATRAPGMDYADGLAFVLQQSPDGYAATGRMGSGLGYAGIRGDRKVGLLLNIYGTPGVRFDGGSESGSFDPVPWLAGGPVSVTLAYDAQARALKATLTRPGFTPFVKTWTGIDLESVLGRQAIMGFTSGTGDSAATQVVSDFVFDDRDGIASFKSVGDSRPTVRLWSTQGGIGASGDEIDVRGVLEADAPLGSIHTNPPPAPPAVLATFGGQRGDGLLVTNSAALDITTASPTHAVVYSTDAGKTWRPATPQATSGGQARRALLQAAGGGQTRRVSIRATEGVNDILVAQVNSRGFRSDPQRVRFVLDRAAPTAPRALVPDRVGIASRTGRLQLAGVEEGGVVTYSVNGGAWSSTYTPVEGWNVVRVRQADVAGNVSKPTTVFFMLKTRVSPVTVALVRDTGAGRTDRVTTDGRLSIRGREFLATVQYSTDGGQTWQGTFTAAVGVNRLLVRQVDRLGNVSEPTAFEFTLERPASGLRNVAVAWWRGIVS